MWVELDVMIGHSFGEISALTAAGVARGLEPSVADALPRLQERASASADPPGKSQRAPGPGRQHPLVWRFGVNGQLPDQHNTPPGRRASPGAAGASPNQSQLS